MNVRSRSVVATSSVLALAGAAILWFAVIRDRPKPLPPEQPKTTAELLVGKWKLVKSNAGLPTGFQATIEFAQDGLVTMWVDNPLEDLRQGQTGVYRLEGATLWMLMNPPAGPRNRTVAIEFPTEDTLITVGWSSGDRQAHEYERVRGDVVH